MQISKNQTLASIIATLLVISMATTLIPQSNVSAVVINGINYDQATADAINAGMTWNLNANASSTRLLLWSRYQDKIPTWVFSVIAPNPVGVGQTFTMVIFNPQVPYQAQDTNSIRYKYHVEITEPDGTAVRIPSSGSLTSDSTGTTYTSDTPDQIGNHSVMVVFEQLNWLFPEAIGTNTSSTTGTAGRDYYGVTFLSSTKTYTVAVQQDPVPTEAVTVYPLPTEYWARPIEGQNNAWGQVSSSWLNSAADRDNGSGNNRVQAQGTAPNSGHILWTKPTEDGGVVGGNSFDTEGQVFNAGHQYQTRFPNNQIIMYGRLYYRESKWYSATPGDYVCVDLRTGEEIWRNVSMSALPAFGYYYDWDDMNQHGVVPPSWLFSSNFGTAIHPLYGITAFNTSSAPSGTEVYGPKGEAIRYVLTNLGNTSNPNYYLAQWNSSKVFISTTSATGTIPANYPLSPALNSTHNNWNGTHWTTSTLRTAQGFASVSSPAYDWNISVSVPSGSSIRAAVYNNVLLISNGTLPTAPSYTYAESVSFSAINLNSSRGIVGSLMWGPTAIKLVDTTNHNYDFQRAAEGVFVFQRTPDMGWMAYDMYTGQKLWESDFGEGDKNPYAYYISSTGYNPTGNAIAYGKLFSTGYSGFVYSYDLRTGNVLWNYSAPTNAEKFKYYTLMVGAINDGKIYIGTHEHSADTPLFKGARVRALNVTDGSEIWTMLGWANPYTVQVADGILTYWNNYDHQVYAIGKGPSALTVEAPMAGVIQGEAMVIRGTVTDISAGTKQKEQAARFPNGVPAISDASQSQWMEYVYMQKPFPTNATGVEVTISVLDSNGNYREIGTATSDASGFYSLEWIPDISGKFDVVATFGGSESYWPSHAETAFTANEAPAPLPEDPIAPPSNTDTYVMYSAVGIIVAIAVVGALIVLLLRKRP